MSFRPRSSKSLLIALAFCLAAAAFLLIYPVYVIRPFRYQGPHELLAALAILRFRLWLEGLLALAALILLIWCWRESRGRFIRISAAVCALLVLACGLLARVNIYELMFNPIDRITFSPASRAKLDGDEEVIAIKIGTAARAYPIRDISYHHIVNDVLDGVPIVATY